jgi:hypothetical protein
VVWVGHLKTGAQVEAGRREDPAEGGQDWLAPGALVGERPWATSDVGCPEPPGRSDPTEWTPANHSCRVSMLKSDWVSASAA